MKNKKIQKKLSGKDLLGISLLVILFLVIVGFIGFYYNESEKIVQLDDEFCPEIVDSLSVILIDQTNQFNVIQKTSIYNEIQDIIKKLEKYERVEVFLLNPLGDELLRPVFGICNPGQGEDETKLSGNKRLKEYNWEKNFYTPLSKVLNSVLEKNESNVSPLMEAIQSISITTFHKYKGTSIKLYVFSDMLQHSPKYSNYSSPLDYNKFKKTQYYHRLGANLKNAVIKIFYISRDTRKQGKNHILFWEEYFNDMGGILSSVKRVEG